MKCILNEELKSKTFVRISIGITKKLALSLGRGSSGDFGVTLIPTSE